MTSNYVEKNIYFTQKVGTFRDNEYLVFTDC